MSKAEELVVISKLSLHRLIHMTWMEAWCEGNTFMALPKDERVESAERCWKASSAKRNAKTHMDK